MSARYTITADATKIGLPKYAVGEWTHYSTHLGEWCLGRMTRAGKLDKHLRLAAADAERMLATGIMCLTTAA